MKQMQPVSGGGEMEPAPAGGTAAGMTTAGRRAAEDRVLLRTGSGKPPDDKQAWAYTRQLFGSM